MSKELTPAEFTFQSFRHSQGQAGLQMLIFRYFDVNFGIRPDLHPTAQDFDRYTKFIGHTAAKSHIQYSPGNNRKPSGEVVAAFKQLRAIQRSNTGRYYAKVPVATLPWLLLNNCVATELGLLTAENFGPERATGYSERIQRRVLAGQASLLQYFGRDGHPTGFDEFNQMYADMWDQAVQLDDMDWWRATSNDLDFAIQTAARNATPDQ